MYVKTAKRLLSEAVKSQVLVHYVEILLHHNHKNEIGFIPRGKIFSQVFKNNILYLFENGQCIGFADFYLRRDGIFKYNHLMIHRDYRQKGYGTKMMKRVERIASSRGATKMLFVAIKESGANVFFQKLGYKQVKPDPKLFKRNPENYNIYEKQFVKIESRGLNID